MSQAVNSTIDLETVLSTIVAKAVQLSGTQAGTIFVFDETSQEFRMRANYGMADELIAAIKEPAHPHGRHGHGPRGAAAQAGADLRRAARSFIARP